MEYLGNKNVIHNEMDNVILKQIREQKSAALQAGRKIQKGIDAGVYRKRQSQVLAYQARALKEIERLQAAGWKVSEATVKKATAPLKERYTKKQVEALHDNLLVSTIRQRAFREVKFNVNVADVKFSKSNPGVLDLNHGKISNYRQVEKTIKVTYNDPGRALRKAMVDTLKYGKNKEEAVNEMVSVISAIGIIGGNIDVFGDNEFKDDFKTNFKKYIPTAKYLTQLLKQAEDKHPIYNTVEQQIELLHRRYGTSLGESAGQWYTDREAVKAAFFNNPNYRRTRQKYDYDKLQKLWENLPSYAWSRYRQLYDSNDVIDYYDEMIVYDPDNYNEEEVLDDFISGVLREDTPDEIHDRSLTNAQRAQAFAENE